MEHDVILYKGDFKISKSEVEKIDKAAKESKLIRKKYKNLSPQDKIFFLERRIERLIEELTMCRNEIKELKDDKERLLNNIKRTYKERRKLAAFDQKLRDDLKVENKALKKMLRENNAT